MGFYRNGKLALGVFQALRSRLSSAAAGRAGSAGLAAENASAIRNPGTHSAGLRYRVGISCKAPAPISRFSKGDAFTGNQSNQIWYSSRRWYYVDRHNVRHFRPRGPARWFENPRVVFAVVVVGAGVVVMVYFGNLETVPYTHRKHFVLLSKEMERNIGEREFENLKKSFRHKILPPIHPDSIRVRMIAKDIIMALKRGIKHRQGWRDLEYSNEAYGVGNYGAADGAVMALRDDGKAEVQWGREDEILDDRWVEESRKKGKKRGAQSMTEHLEGLNWEVVVVNEPMVNAFCLPGGKIVVFTGLLDNFRTDAEIATVLGHEIAHCIARHAAEGMTKNLWYFIVQIVLFQFVPIDVANTMSYFFLRLPFSRRMEIEADYIGLLLMAAAGYVPRVAPKVYEMLGQLTGESALRDYLSTHPSGKTRAKLLSQAKVMEEALAIYSEAIAGHGVEGFL